MVTVVLVPLVVLVVAVLLVVIVVELIPMVVVVVFVVLLVVLAMISCASCFAYTLIVWCCCDSIAFCVQPEVSRHQFSPPVDHKLMYMQSVLKLQRNSHSDRPLEAPLRKKNAPSVQASLPGPL